jgi:hypothetical protein
VVEIVPALLEEADGLRTRQLAALKRFLEAVVANRAAVGVSGLTDSLRSKTETGEEKTNRARRNEMRAQTTEEEKVDEVSMRFAFYVRVSTEDALQASYPTHRITSCRLLAYGQRRSDLPRPLRTQTVHDSPDNGSLLHRPTTRAKEAHKAIQRKRPQPL